MKAATDKIERKYVGVWLEIEDYKALVYLAKKNNRSLAGEIRNRLLGTTTAAPIGK